jgi:hypothetical protein
MYSFQHGHFFDLDMPETDLILHGHGFDYLFQGMYLPATRNTFLRRPIRSYSLDVISTGFIGQYTQEAKYRLKGINPLNLLSSKIVDKAMGKIVSDLNSVVEPIAAATTDLYDQWDYLTTSSPGRHYTYLNLQSAGTLAEQRTIAFTNDIFDLYYSTPAKVRYGTTLLASTIKQLNPRLLEVRNANTNMRPDLSPARLTLETWSRGFKRRLGIARSNSADPSPEDRSWPTSDRLLRNSSTLRDKASHLGKSELIESLGIFDMTKIHAITEIFNSGNEDVAPSLLSLITIETLLNQS